MQADEALQKSKEILDDEELFGSIQEVVFDSGEVELVEVFSGSYTERKDDLLTKGLELILFSIEPRVTNRIF